MKNTFADKIKQGYDAIADVWEKERDWYLEQNPLKQFISHLEPKAKILDVGCGSGKPIAAYLITKGFDVFGMDISPKQIEHAKHIIPEDQLFIADICSFETALRFDGIVCWFALFHIPTSQYLAVLKKFYSFLNPNGILCITFADTNVEPEGTELKIIDENTIESEMFGERFIHSGLPAEKNTQLIEEVGFSIISNDLDQPGNQVIIARKNSK
ncbi:MAG: class I SAM-dependent methyltransferase [Legionella sp.]|nr:MAG: class I SAM-dependent methyltransferase [Legionella sp.]